MLDGKFVGAQLVRALVGIGTGLRHVEAQRDGCARGLVGEGPRGPREDRRHRKTCADGGPGLQQPTAIKLDSFHSCPPFGTRPKPGETGTDVAYPGQVYPDYGSSPQ